MAKDALLLARLALDGQQPRSTLALWLWPDVPPSRAHANLRQRLFRLRRHCDLVQELDAGLRLAASVHCDLLLDGIDAELGDPLAPLLGALAAEAIDDAVQDWLDGARRRCAARQADRLARHAQALEGAGKHEAALAITEQLLLAQPLLEHGWRRLMRLHSLRGDRAAALAAFERCEAVLRDEFGVKPAPETQALLHEVELRAAVQTAPARAGGQEPLPMNLLHPPRLVGRLAQRRAMAAAWQAGSAFVLVGVAGQGKSRLLAELAGQGPGRVLESARPGDDSLSYGALSRLLRSMHRAAPRPDALWPAGAAAHELARLLPELGPAPAAPGMEALLHGAIEQVFDNAPRAGLNAVLFDDLQHADDATRTVLRRVMGSTGLLWGLACRPESGVDLAGWLASSARLQSVALPGLADEDLHELLQSLQLPRLDATALLPALARHCGGNPLFVLETLKHLVLHEPPPDAGSGSLPLPPSVEALLSQRLMRLSQGAQDLARVAAVAGADFHAEVAADVLGIGLVSLADPWSELQQAQVLRGDADATTDVFVHESLRDAVLRSVPQPLRAPLHARVARSLRERGAPPQRVARHFAAAGDLRAAAPLALAAAAEALRLGRVGDRLQQLRQAAGWYASAGDGDAAFDAELASAEACLAQEGLDAAQALTDMLLGRARMPQQRVAVRLAQAELGVSAYAADRALTAATAALAEAAPGSVEELRASVLHAAALARSHDVGAALAATHALLPRLADLEDAALAAGLWGHCAVVFNSNGDTDRCVHALEQQRLLAHRVGHSELEAAALASLGSQLAMLGEIESSIDKGQQAVALHRRIGAAHTALLCEINVAVALIGKGELLRARNLLQAIDRGLQGRSEGGDLMRVVAEMHAAVHLRLGQADDALQVLQASAAWDTLHQLAQPRQLNRLALRGLALQQQGAAVAAADCWHALGEKVPRDSRTGLHLRSRVLATQVLPDAAARAELDLVLQASLDTRFPAGEALARMQRIERALQGARCDAALQEVPALLALRVRARHLFLSEWELLALVLRTYAACGQPDRAATLRAELLPWLQQEQLPLLPPLGADAWRRHPAHAALWAAAG